MKNKLFLFATFLLVSLGALASNSSNSNSTTLSPYINNYGNSFTFVESGVTFSVFQNGEFDFYINPRSGFNASYQGNGINISYNSGYNYDAYVQYDDFGAIIQIENIPIYYDYYGRVERVGNININYNNGRLARLGGLRVYYDNYGSYSHYSGYINIYNRNYVYHPYHNYFVRPLLDFRIISYKPYRNHYKVNRYRYYNDHSRNKYYNNNKYYSRNKTYAKNDNRQRVATNVPKRRTDNVTFRNDNRSKSNSQINRNNSTNRNSNVINRTNSNSRAFTNRSNIEKRTPNRTFEKSANRQTRSVTNRNNSVNNRNKNTSIQNRSKVTSRTPVRNTKIAENRTKNTQTRQPVRVQEKRNTIKQVTRKPVGTKSSSSENTRKRRGS